MIHQKMEGGAAPPSKCQKIIKQIIKNCQKGAGSVAGGQPDPRAGSRDAGSGGIPFFYYYFYDHLMIFWHLLGGAAPPSIF